MVDPVLPTSTVSPELAAVYQPRRTWAAAFGIGWNLLLITVFVADEGPWRLYQWLAGTNALIRFPSCLPVIYLVVCFIAYAAANYPLELWFGYLQDRQFGLAKDGVRAWTTDWFTANTQHAMLFLIGSGLLLAAQHLWPMTWALWFSMVLLGLFIATNYFALELLPPGMFELEEPDAQTAQRIAQLAGGVRLPPVTVFTSPSPRAFVGGIIGLWGRQRLMLSRSTVTAASDSVLRFVLRHDAGHRQYHHQLLATLAGWAWVSGGLVLNARLLSKWQPGAIGLAPCIPLLALLLTVWMAVGEPLLAYLGRRMEYQADRYYLRNGGTLGEMQEALEELGQRNLVRTESQRRRETIFHPLPSVWNRLHAARRVTDSLLAKNEGDR